MPMDADLATLAGRALDRGDPAALALFDRALKSDPGNPRLWLGKARALEIVGDLKGARIVTAQIADQAPGFIEAQSYLAQLRSAAGEADFASHFALAAGRHPQDPNIPVGHIDALAGLDRPAEAAEVAATARENFPTEPHFALLEAIYAGAAGQWEHAEAIYAGLDYAPPQRAIHEARHRLRAQDWEAADALLEHVLAAEPWDVAAWALRGITWRIGGDARAEWLHGQPGLVRTLMLDGPDSLIAAAAETLRAIHQGASMPLGQSLRGGTQTRGLLFDRPEPELRALHAAIARTLDEYRAGLPSNDPSHPLLRHRDAPWRLSASWSVRLTGGGDHHAAHIHPGGMISSALYLIVPDATKDPETQSGWLELGRPPRDLGLDLEPDFSIRPQAGHLALFPATLFHGTTPFGSGERLTVAFDVSGN